MDGVTVAEWPTGEWVVDPATQLEWPVPEGIPPERVVEHARRADAGELRRLRLDVDHGVDWPLWGRGGNLGPGDPVVSRELAAELRAWAAFRAEHLILFEGWDAEANAEAWRATGVTLARRLQLELYDSASVVAAFLGPDGLDGR